MTSGGRAIGDSDNTAPEFGRMPRPIQKFMAFASPLPLGIPPVAWGTVQSLEGLGKNLRYAIH